MYAYAGTEILVQREKEVQMAVMSLVRAEVYILAVCRIVLRTAVSYIEAFCGVRMVRLF